MLRRAEKGEGCPATRPDAAVVGESSDYVEALEARNRELEAFLAAVSHDLRSPLRSIEGFARALAEDHGLGLPPDARGYLHHIRANAERMSGMLEGLLRLSHTGEYGLAKTAVDIGRLASSVLRRLRAEDPERQVQWAVQEPLVAVGDEGLLAIVMENLVGNAWKFTSRVPLGKITFSGGTRQGQPVYRLCDNGVGIEESQMPRLFKPFQRLHAQESYPGVGIGLVTVQRIIARHGGSVWAERNEGSGVTFCFTL